MFKTIKLESSDKWAATYVSPLGSGSINELNLIKKESYYFSNLLRNSGNYDTVFLSAQGIGEVVSSSLNPSYVDVFFKGNVGNTISLATYPFDPVNPAYGDILFIMDMRNIYKLTTITE